MPIHKDSPHRTACYRKAALTAGLLLNSVAIRSSASFAIAEPVVVCTSNSFLRLCAQHATSRNHPDRHELGRLQRRATELIRFGLALPFEQKIGVDVVPPGHH
jgi:hypothetical protein